MTHTLKQTPMHTYTVHTNASHTAETIKSHTNAQEQSNGVTHGCREEDGEALIPQQGVEKWTLRVAEGCIDGSLKLLLPRLTLLQVVS